MKKQVNNKLAALIIFILVVMILVAIYYSKKQKNVIINVDYEEATTRVVVVKSENGMALVMDDDPEYPSVYRIGASKDREYKQGNELLIHYNGYIMESYPAQFSHITKIEFIKEQSDIEIPESILKSCYNSEENIRVTIHEISDSEIALSIVDANKYPYNYPHNYKINKKVKNKDYKEKGEIIGENTKNTIAGYTRNRPRICLGRSK